MVFLQTLPMALIALVPLWPQTGPADEGQILFETADQYRVKGEFGKAIETYQKAIALKFEVAEEHAQIARVQARQGDQTAAISSLWKAARYEFARPEVLKDDPDFAKLRIHPEFAPILKLVERNGRPCDERATRRQFDLWLGRWEAFDPTGKKVGESVIEKVSNGCAIQENRTPVGGLPGKSLNYFNPHSGQWNQDWVGGNGRLSPYVGELVDGKMVMVAPMYTGAKRVLLRMTFSSGEGTFRQVGERSADGGQTWHLAWDYIYRRKRT